MHIMIIIEFNIVLHFSSSNGLFEDVAYDRHLLLNTIGVAGQLELNLFLKCNEGQ